MAGVLERVLDFGERVRRSLYLYAMLNKQADQTAGSFQYRNGDTTGGSVMALQVGQDGANLILRPLWVTGVNQGPTRRSWRTASSMPWAPAGDDPDSGAADDPGRRRGLPFTPVGHQVLYAMDAETGIILYDSKIC